MSRRLITIFGATGNQGGSVIKTLLSKPELKHKYKIRAITRNTSKPGAQKLASQGCELVKADLNDQESIEVAIKGSYGVFAVTDYYESVDKNIEETQGRTIVDISKAAGVAHLVWSGLPNVTKLTHGKLAGVNHFDSKAAVTEYGDQVKGDMIFSCFMPGFFMSNVKAAIQSGEGGVPTLYYPWSATETKVPMFDVQADSGKFVAGLFEAGKAADDVKVQAVSQWMTPQEIADTIKEVQTKEIKFVELPREAFKAFMPPAVAEELTQNMEFIREYSYYGKGADKEQDKSDEFLLQGTKLNTWQDFVKVNGVGA